MKSPVFSRTQRRRFIGVSLAALGAGTLGISPAWAQAAKLGEEATALATVVKFRFLSQRLAKAYGSMLMGSALGADVARAKAILDSAKQLMTTHADTLAKIAAIPADVKQQLGDVTRLATTLMNQTVEPPTKAAVQTVSNSANAVLKAANDLAQTLEKLIAQPAARLVNLSGTNRFLSQRIAKNYFLHAAGIDAATPAAEIDADLVSLKANLKTLQAAPLNTSAIKAELDLAQSQLLFFEAATKKAQDPVALRDVLSTSERLMEVMDKLTGLYEGALKAAV